MAELTAIRRRLTDRRAELRQRDAEEYRHLRERLVREYEEARPRLRRTYGQTGELAPVGLACLSGPFGAAVPS